MDNGVETLIKSSRNYEVEFRIKNGTEKQARFFQNYPIYSKFLDGFKNRKQEDYDEIKTIFMEFFQCENFEVIMENPMNYAIVTKKHHFVQSN